MLKPISFQLCSLVYLLLLVFVSIAKYRHKNKKMVNIIYQSLLVFTLFVLLMDIITNLMIQDLESFGSIVKYFGKTYLIASILWCYGLLLYVLLLNNDDAYYSFSEMFKKSRGIRLAGYLSIILSVIVCFLKSEFIFRPDDMVSYQSGIALYFTFVVCFVYMGIMAIYIIYNPHNVSDKQRTPIFMFIFLGLLSIVLQWIYSSVLLVSSVMSFVMLFIYFTMENPDIRIINDLEKDKEEVEEASKAKTDLL